MKAYKDVLEKAKAVLEDKKSDGKDVEDIIKSVKRCRETACEKDDVKKMRIKIRIHRKVEAVQTGDQTPIMFWAFMLVASAVVIFRRRKKSIEQCIKNQHRIIKYCVRMNERKHRAFGMGTVLFLQWR